ncbi:hypothetical protein RN001_014410 [Aquatica leii]|uniref:C2H2-type domain-containing protein n=1 Tax=Aquatica leii TaxID=1421715 RepID=A0AAN7NZJ3_9COLE|nr:hypothetical protein RN001_014410 [Aquatica leii]
MCSDCGKQFKTKSELTHHNRSKCGTVKQYTCKVCDQKLMTAGSLHNHMLRHTVKCSNMCGFCGKMFLTRGQLKVHERTHTQEKAFVCNVCGKGFCHRQSLITHSTLHTGVKPYQCENCGNAFSCVGNTDNKEVEYEFMDAVVKEEPTSQNKNDETGTIEETKKSESETFESLCRYCGKTYTNMRWLFRHEKQHEGVHAKISDQFKCACCKMTFPTREECKEHKQRTHADLLSCQDCDKIFSNKDSLRSHCRLFHKGLPKKIYTYVCEKCGVQFRQKAFLNYHKKNNCGSGPIYECHVCGKGFHSIHTRWSHLRIHDPKKKFLCKYCGKSFRWKGQLKVHERSHTGEKPFKCLYCPKAFGYRESLITHSSLHTGIKPHLCQACGSRFSCIGNLIKHRTTHASTCGVWYSKNQ